MGKRAAIAFLALWCRALCGNATTLTALPQHLRPDPFGAIVPADRVAGGTPSRFAAVKPAGLVPENATDSFAIIDSKWKFIDRNKAARSGIQKVELYDRVVDRVERQDLSAQHPREVEERMAALRQWIDAQNKIRAVVGHAGATKLDSQTLEQMRSLGYLGGPSQ